MTQSAITFFLTAFMMLWTTVFPHVYLEIYPQDNPLRFTVGSDFKVQCLLLENDSVRVNSTVSETEWRSPHGEAVSYNFNERVFQLLSGNISHLIFTNTKNEDEGMYTCYYGEKFINKTIEIIAVEHPYHCPSEQFLVKGKTSTIHCRINGTNYLEWTFNNSSLRNSTRHLVNEIGLTISEVELLDEGIYYVTGHEENTGKSVFRNISVSVYYPPHFRRYYEEYTYDQGSSAILRCDAMANPRSTYTWTNKYGHIINSSYSSRMLVDAWGSLHVEDLRSEDAGLYSCGASNSLGFASKDVRLIVSISNKTISNETELFPELEVVNVTVNSIQLYITSSSSEWFSYYYITFRNQYDTYNTTVRKRLSSDIYTLMDLTPGDAFRIKVAGKMNLYEGNMTEFSREIFVQLLPPSPYLIVNHVYDSSVKLEWIPRGAYTTSYGWNGLKSVEIQYQQMTQKNGELHKEQNCEVLIIKKPCAGNTHVIGGLPKPNSRVYTFQVRVENGAGFSDWVSVFIKY